MNKRELKKWVEEQRSSALSELTTQFDQAREHYRDELVESTGLKEIITKLADSEVLKEYIKWRADHKEDLKLTGEAWRGDLDNALFNLDNRSIKDSVNKFLDFSTDYKRTTGYCALKQTYYKTRAEINKNYDVLIQNLVICKTAKEAVAYLKGLGFEVPEDKEMTTAIVAPVDVKYLLLPKKTAE